MAIVSAMTAPVLLGLRAAPIAWDARSIWFFHASWFQAGGARTASAIANPAFTFSQADYPPLAPASNASLWTLYRGGDRWVAMTMNVGFTLSAVVLVGLLVARIARPRAQLLASVVGGLLALAMFGTSGGTAMEGLVDLLWAAWIVSGAIALLVLPRTRTNQLLGATCLAAAGLTKAEGFAIALVVVFAVALRFRRQLGAVVLPATAVLPAVFWAVLVRLVGATGTVAVSGPGVRGLFNGNPAIWHRVTPTLSSLWSEVGPLGVVGAAILAVAALALSGRRYRLGVVSGAWLVGLSAISVVVFLFVYVTGPYEIRWWLSTSVSRTTISVRALALTELAICLVVIVDVALSGPLKDRSDEGRTAAKREVRRPGLPHLAD